MGVFDGNLDAAGYAESPALCVGRLKHPASSHSPVTFIEL